MTFFGELFFASIFAPDKRIKFVSEFERLRSSKPSTSYNTLQDTDESIRWTNFGQVEVRSSTIPAAGDGLFATHDLKYGDVVTEYVGTYYHTDDEYYEMKNSNYIFAMNYGWNLDGFPHLEKKLTSKELGSKPNSVLSADKGNENCDCRIIICNKLSGTPGPSKNVFAGTSIGQVHKTKVSKQRRFIVCKKDVEKGKELFLFYGDDYWRVHEL